jgi:acyl-CoA ligase (AMP-forming) (exosortase A-associated)
MSNLIFDLIFDAARRSPHAQALVCGAAQRDYAALALDVERGAQILLGQGVERGDRVAVYLEKRLENVAAMFGASLAGAVFVPINPLLKAEQVCHILNDCNVRVLVTSPERLLSLGPILSACPELRAVLLTGDAPHNVANLAGVKLGAWDSVPSACLLPARAIDVDVAAILYTSGSTGMPKGVVLSHRNLVAGAESVASYLDITHDDRLLAVLPLSFDYGLSQLTCAFRQGATVVLINHLFARDIMRAVVDERITGLAAVPPLWNQLARLAWPSNCTLRYVTNSGGAMPGATLAQLRAALPDVDVFLMYGLTEAFRSTYLPPSELDRRPGSMGRAIPNAEVLVVRPDGSLCADDEPGELVHRGALVSLGYWNDPAKTAERFRPAPRHNSALPLVEMAVWSGDTVRRDADGYLYYIGRDDDLIKVSGYRISPTEIEETLHASGLVDDVAAFGVPHPGLGQVIVVLAVAPAGLTVATLLKEAQRRLPAYMVPVHIALRTAAFPRNPNGKLDRKLLRADYVNLFEGAS